MKNTWLGWEVFRFIKDENSGNYLITSWTHDQKVLCSNSDGTVYTVNMKDLIEEGRLKSQEWKIINHPISHGVRIQSVEHGRSLVFSGQDLYTMNKDKDTAWHLQPAHRNQFFLTSATTDDTRLSCTKEHKLVSHKNRKSWEKWIVKPTNSTAGNFTIRSVEHEKYLSTSEDGKLVVSESHHWSIGSSSYCGGVFIQSAEHGHRLSLNNNNYPCTVKANGGWKTWILEPMECQTQSVVSKLGYMWVLELQPSDYQLQCLLLPRV